MASIYFDATARAWREKCGCAGGDKTYIPLANSQPLMFNVNANTNVKGQKTGKTYFVRPNMVALDIQSEDAVLFIQNAHAALVLPSMFAGKQGYRAIIS